ncbi:MAG: hypothetical protein H0V51_11740 [Chloroflexi bacterium]|nr:hypothetical protein [Chloroflexota bacterium]
MIRQLRTLTRTVPGTGGAALAVYAERHDGQFTLRQAAEQGVEGVACVDDAARAAILYSAIWRERRLPWARTAAEAMLRFVGYMQADDGRFANFILDWEGRKNLRGSSSFLGGWPWTARAMHALAVGAEALEDAECAERFRRGLVWLDRPCPYFDVRAVCVLAALEYWNSTHDASMGERALSWAEEIADARLGDVLPDAAGDPNVHLWGHLQEVALARVGLAFARVDLVEAARASADVVFVPSVERSFTAPRTLPFEVSCAVLGLAAVASATGESRYATYAALARDWFHGRNPAGRPVYDRMRGLVYDGIDGSLVNANSGAESNVEGALALFDSLSWESYSEPTVTPLVRKKRS